MLLHVRTSPFFYPEGLRALYQGCRDAGIDYIALLEYHGFSQIQLRHQTFESMAADAEARGEFLTHHNYKRTLAKAGFEICHMQMLPPFSLYAYDGNSVFLVARRTPEA